MNFLTLIARCKDEPFLTEFVNYYLAEGVDAIHLLDDESTLPIPSEVLLNDKVTVHQSENFKNGEMRDANKLFSQIKRDSEWFIFVDCDEFITTKINSANTIKDELLTTFKDADCVKIPWVMMACNGRENDPGNLLEEMTHRWDHDKKHPHPHNWPKGRCRYDRIEVKCIFKGSKFNRLKCHHPFPPGKNPPSYICVESINGQPSELNPFYNNLREADIKNAYLICHHYRVISLESCVRKVTTTNLQAYKTTIENLMLCDFPEIIDETLKIKSQKLRRNA